MCGRYTFTPGEDMFDHFFLDPDYERGGDFDDNNNVSPGQFMSVVVKGEKYNTLRLMRWGLVPSWAKDEKIGFQMFNARAESITEKPSFKAPFKRHRCLIPASGFYEWKKDAKIKTSYYFTLKDQSLFAFAGLFDTWTSPDGSELESYTIITTKPNSLMEAIHDRMPVILSPESEKIWLNDNSEEAKLKSLLMSYPSDLMKASLVSPH